MTAIVDARGEVQAALPPFATGVLRGKISAYRGSTPYLRFGNLPPLALMLASLLAACAPRRRKTA